MCPDDIVVAWNQSTLDRLEDVVGLPARHLHLKSAYRSHAKHARGPLTTLVQELELPRASAPPLCGRAGRHVHELLALVAHLQTAGRG